MRKIALFEGEAGWSEFSPFEEYTDEEAARWLEATIDFAQGDYVERAVARGVKSVPVNAIVPAVSADEVARFVPRESVCVKVKVAERGQDLREDIARVRAVRERAPQARIRVDANGCWSVQEGMRAAKELGVFHLQYMEQPCRSVEELAQLRAQLFDAAIPVKIAADESIRRAEDPYRVAQLQAADYIVLKVQPLGGVARALRIAQECRIPAVVSGAIESSAGLAAGAALAAALPGGEAAGLATLTLLHADAFEDSLTPHNSRIDLRRPTRLSPLARKADEYWVERVTHCYRILERKLT